MLSCFFCLNYYESMTKLIFHVKICHKALRNIEVSCNVENCKRSFHNVHSLIRHIQLQHFNAKASNLRSKNSEVCVRQIDIFENVKDKPLNLDNVLSLYTAYVETTATNELTVEEFQSLLHYSAVVLTAKLYANSSLSRKLIRELIDNMKSFYTISLKVLNKKVTSTSEIAEMLRIVEHIFDDFKSKHLTSKIKGI